LSTEPAAPHCTTISNPTAAATVTGITFGGAAVAAGAASVAAAAGCRVTGVMLAAGGTATAATVSSAEAAPILQQPAWCISTACSQTTRSMLLSDSVPASKNTASPCCRVCWA
jgi:hypothetical protein